MDENAGAREPEEQTARTGAYRSSAPDTGAGTGLIR